MTNLPPDTPVAVRLHAVRKRFGEREVLRGLDATIGEGSAIGLVGGNGVGKTTLIKCILDFCAPSDGAIELFGVDSRLPAARRGLAYLPERFVPPHYLSGEEFLRYAAALSGESIDERRCAEMLDLLGFDRDARSRPVRKLSKGMTQKLGLAAALAPQRRLYLLDEPMSGLDPMSRVAVKSVMRRLHAENRTLFMTSHILSDVEESCDRMLVLHDGRLLFDGTRGELLSRHDETSLERAYMRCVSDERRD